MKRIARRTARFMLGACILGILAVIVTWFAVPFPFDRLDRLARSPVVTDANGAPLLALVGPDDQWRRPVTLDDMAPALLEATIAVEDERFHSHPGVDPVAIGRAVMQNATAGRVISGASTLTMQVCRMMDPRPRTVSAKCVEAFRATQLDARWSKEQVLEMYLNLAPYGGNVRGVEAAARRYFGRAASDLTIAESALLAGLPQSPERLRPDRHPEAARVRRDHVLDRMLACGFIDAAQYHRARATPVRLAPPQHTVDHTTGFHVARAALSERAAGGRTTIDAVLQARAEAAARDDTGIAGADVSIVIIDVETSEIRAWVGSSDPADPVDGQVDGVRARRSPGSALKPFIFALAFAEGRLAPDSLMPDTRIDRAGWRPENFDRTYHGTMAASDALAESRNVPAILLTEVLGARRCEGLFGACGITLPPGTAARSGLALAVGATETTLLDLTNAYATLARGGVRRTPSLFADAARDPGQRALPNDAAAAVNSILASNRRPPAGLDLVAAADRPWFMWKTGTSAGRRDALAIGHNERYAIGVWVGRFSGAGHPGFVGAEAAEPILAALFADPELESRRAGAPGNIQSIAVRRPITWPTSERRLRITAPADGDVHLARGASARIHLRATPQLPGSTWFVDGLVVDGDAVDLSPGTHEIRIVGPDGSADACRIDVRG